MKHHGALYLGGEYDKVNLDKIIRKIPDDDFADAQFDKANAIAPTDLIVVLSTPRSGSTMLCEEVYRNLGCVVHEYFQPYEYLPLLAARWGCLKAGRIEGRGYVQELVKHRGTEAGWLGVNLHGHHIPEFRKIQHLFAGLRWHQVYLERRDLLAQAVSYEIASQTQQWSSQFLMEREPRYSFEAIRGKLRRIQEQQALILAYLACQSIGVTHLIHEELISDTDAALGKLAFLKPGFGLGAPRLLKRQSGFVNAEWATRFSEDLLSDDV